MKNIFTPAIGITLVALMTTPVMAAPVAPSQAADANPTLNQLTTELDALNSMNDTMGHMVTEVETRTKLMKAFIQAKGLTDEYRSAGPAKGTQAFHGLSFQQAYKSAVDQQKLRGAATPPTTDVSELQTEVSATQSMVQNQWNRMNTMHADVANMTAFIQSKTLMDSYHKWASSDAAAKAMRPTKVEPASPRGNDSKISPEQREENIRNYQAQQAALRKHWDNYHFTYATSKAVAPIFGTTDSANYVAPDYYNNQWWNGYGDPYYDVWGGYPTNWGGANGWRHAYRRGMNPRPAIAPAHGHAGTRPHRR